MTSQKSSANPFMHTFKNSLFGSNAAVAALLLFPLSLITILPTLSTLMSKYMPSYENANEAIEIITAADRYTYVLLTSSDFTVYPLIGIVVIGAILMGISSFKFITTKKTVNVYYSLGITREKLFSASFLAGAIMLVLPIIIVFLAIFVSNLAIIGSSVELLKATLYFFFSLSTIALVCFSVTAAVFSSVGTFFEGGVFSGLVIGFPTIILTCIELLMSTLVWGSPYGNSFTRVYSSMGNSNSLSLKYNYTSPLTAFSKNLMSGSALDIDKKTNPELYNNSSTFNPDFLPIILWFVVSVAVFAFGMYIFKKRKAEICGFIGTNKTLNSVAIFTIGFFAFCGFFTYSPIESSITNIMIGLGIITIIFCIINLVLLRNLKSFVSSLKFLPAHFAVAIAIVIVFSSGFLGFSSRIPSTEDIESIDISTLGAYDLVTKPPNSFYYSDEFVFSGVPDLINGFTSEKDKELIADLHKEIIEQGFKSTKLSSIVIENDATRYLPTTIQIVYNLKNGTTIQRNYNVISGELAEKLLSIEKTDRYKEIINDTFDGKIELDDKDDVNYISNILFSKQALSSDTSQILLYPASFSYEAMLELNEEQRIELRECLLTDNLNLSIEEKYFPQKAELGMLSYSYQYDSYPVPGLEKPEATESESEESVEDPESEYAPSNESALWQITSENPIINFANAGYGSLNFIITEDMEKTIEFLTKYDFIDALTQTELIYESVQLISVERSLTFQPWMYEHYAKENTPLFYGSVIQIFEENEHFYYNSSINADNSLGIEDHETIQALSDVAHISYFTKGTGFIAKFKLSEKNGYVTKYIASKDMPKDLASDILEFDAKNTSNYR